MARVRIDDLKDPRLAVYQDLKASNATRDLGQFVVEGEKLVDRLVASRYPVASVLTDDRHEPILAGRVPESLPLYVVPDGLVTRLVGYNFHQGVLAAGVRIPAPSLDDILAEAGERATLLIAPRIDNPENLGALVRIADVFGVDAVVVGDRCPDPLSRRVLRVSMGTVLHLPVAVASDLAGDVERLRERHGFGLVATVVEPGAVALDAFERPARVGVFFGCEGNGLGPEWVGRCGHRLTIPMRPGAESLNLAVAAGIVVHRLMSR